MIEIIKELDVEVTKPNIFQAIVAKQYDMNTRFLRVTFKDGGTRIDIPNIETARVIINAERKDGQAKGFDGVINDDGTVTVPLHSWMLELDGTVICDISVIDMAADDNKKLTTTSFTLLVEKAAYGGEGITNDPQFDILVELLEMCGEAESKAEDALAKSTEANSKYDACVEAAARANEAADAAFAAEQNVRDGGYIESLKEMNKGGKFKVWVGSQEEYYSDAATLNNTFCIITDDAEGEKIRSDISDVQKQCDDLTKSWAEGFEELSGRMESIESNMSDYIYEVGTNQGWSYRRWASGYYEAEYNLLTPNPHAACTTQVGSGIYLDDSGGTQLRCPDFVKTITSLSHNIYYDFPLESGYRTGVSGAFVTDDGIINDKRYISYRLWSPTPIERGIAIRIMVKISGYYNR